MATMCMEGDGDLLKWKLEASWKSEFWLVCNERKAKGKVQTARRDSGCTSEDKKNILKRLLFAALTVCISADRILLL